MSEQTIEQRIRDDEQRMLKRLDELEPVEGGFAQVVNDEDRHFKGNNAEIVNLEKVVVEAAVKFCGSLFYGHHMPNTMTLEDELVAVVCVLIAAREKEKG